MAVDYQLNTSKLFYGIRLS